MTLTEAFDLLHGQSSARPPFYVTLACGFTPLHLGTFLTAHLAVAVPAKSIELRTGVFGDPTGALERLPADTEAVAVAVEWADLDARLGYRSLVGWGPAQQAEYPFTVDRALERLRRAIQRIPLSIPVAVSAPTLPIAPAFHTGSRQAGACELQLRSSVAAFLAELARRQSVRIVNETTLLVRSGEPSRLDPRADVLSGFPYTVSHSSALAASLAGLLVPQPAKKGLITDLDNTLWSGAAGEIGADSVRWDLSGAGHRHGVYQKLLRALADHGVLIAAASKNNRAAVDAVFARADLALPPQAIFPVEASWQPKSKSVGHILETWKVSPESVVFVDDDPMEIAEVKAGWPAMECVPLEQAQSTIVAQFDPPASEYRVLELVNKTNQFNLNGVRYWAAEWLNELSRPGGFALVVSYQDRFGPLGRIAVLKGVRARQALEITTWVMSCRAFSRRIEHQCLKILFDHFQAEEIRLKFCPTARNGPLGEILQTYAGAVPAGPVSLSQESFRERAPALYKVELRDALAGTL